MQYVDNPLEPGVSKLLVNMVSKDYGKRIRPRGGWRNLIEPVLLGTFADEAYIHHSGTIFVQDTDTDDVSLNRYALVVEPDEEGFAKLEGSKLLIEKPLDILDPDFNIKPGKLMVSNLKEDAEPYKIKSDTRDNLNKMHGVAVENTSPIGIHASIEGNTYLLTPEGLGRLHVYHSEADGFTHEVKLVTPLEVTPMQAVNYGYNMLLEDPYNFSNASGATFMPQGILPYDPETNLIKMQAKIGEPVRFKLIYTYKEDEEYRVRWEVQDIYKRGDATVIEEVSEESPTYQNGDDIYIDYTSPLKQFSVIATIFEKDDLVNPLRVILLASYHLADDSQTTQMEQKNFDLMTAKGTTTWLSQTIYYGVEGSEMAVFISDVNDPTYVPFPHNTIIFNEKVLKAFPFMNSLLVITEHTMYQVDHDSELGFVVKSVQTNMQLREDDTATMYGIRNMICFKSRNYYYMVVPKVNDFRGELQIAPVSSNVTNLLDTFQESLTKIISEVYTPAFLFNVPDSDVAYSLVDFTSYPDGNRIRHVYKIKIKVQEASEYYVDFHMIYDTVFRTWTIEIVQTNKQPLHVFQSLSTDHSQFLGLVEIEGETYVQWIGIDDTLAEDNFWLTEEAERVMPNYQLFDTGKRDLEGTHKKRLRQVIVEINNLSKEDVEFNHMVRIDDEPRTDLFKYTVEHDTDPESPNYGRIYVERQYTDPATVYGETMLNTWSLGNSQFPQQTVLKLHLDITGKGYYPRLKLITRTSRLYELNTVTWVYRDMNAR